jgi:LacI family transcriptional regulator
VGAKTPLTDAVFIDNHHGAAMATNHLVENGHTRIGVISGMSDRLGNRVTEDRREGFITALERAGLTYDDAIDFPGEFSAPGGFEATENLLKAKKPPTAVWSMSDEMAFGAIRAIKEHGLRMPGDISLIGFDEHDLAFTHGLSTIAQRPADLGAEAVRLLLHRIADPATPPREMKLPLELIQRDSVGPPK